MEENGAEKALKTFHKVTEKVFTAGGGKHSYIQYAVTS